MSLSKMEFKSQLAKLMFTTFDTDKGVVYSDSEYLSVDGYLFVLDENNVPVPAPSGDYARPSVEYTSTYTTVITVVDGKIITINNQSNYIEKSSEATPTETQDAPVEDPVQTDTTTDTATMEQSANTVTETVEPVKDVKFTSMENTITKLRETILFLSNQLGEMKNDQESMALSLDNILGNKKVEKVELSEPKNNNVGGNVKSVLNAPSYKSNK